MENNQTTTENIKKRLGIGSTSSAKSRWLVYFLLLALVAASAFCFVRASHKKEKIRYETAKIEEKELVIIVSATGNLEPKKRVEVGIEVSGTVSHLYADFNQHVTKGAVLARLDTTKLESFVTNSQAVLLAAKANSLERKISLEDAKHELDRGENMFRSTKGHYPSEKEIDALRNSYSKALANYEAAKAGVTQAEAKLNSDRDNLKKAVVLSPIDGIVLSRKIEVGQTLVAALQTPVLFTLAEDLTEMEVILSVDEADIGKVKEGQEVRFSVDAYPKISFHGTIIQVRFDSVIVGGVVTYETVVAVDNAQLLLRPGMTASAEIITKVLPPSLLVPNQALRFSPHEEAKDGKNRVWVLEAGLPKGIVVYLLESDGIMSSVSSAELSEGMPVILNSLKEK